jgi:hypothetical protein
MVFSRDGLPIDVGMGRSERLTVASRESPQVAHFQLEWSGKARRLCPGTSDVDLLRDLNGVVDLDTEVADGALDFGMSEQQLDRPQVAGSPIDQRGLSPAQRVGSELEGIEADAGYPLTNQAGVLSGSQAAIASTPAGEEELPSAPACDPEMVVDWATRKWLEDLRREHSACSCCDARFSPAEPPSAFLVLIPVISDPQTVSAKIGGICPECSKHENKWLLDNSLRRGSEVLSPPLIGPDFEVS